MVNKLDIIKDKLYNNIYRVDVFEKEYKKMFGKSKNLYLREHEQLAINLCILDTETVSYTHLPTQPTRSREFFTGIPFSLSASRSARYLTISGALSLFTAIA